MLEKIIQSVKQAVLTGKRALQKQGKININKVELIDTAFKNIAPTAISVADLGGVWRVNGSYTFFILDKYNIKSAYLVDTDFTEAVHKKAQNYRNLTLLKGNFGGKETLNKLGKLDVVILFDVLLHQVKPDWDEVLEMYSKIAKTFIIYNQQFIKSKDAVRLLDLGKDEYFKNVPCDKDHPTYKALFEKMDEIHPEHNRKWRDIHNVWQWGITDHALCAKMEQLKFDLKFKRNYGQFGNLKNFHDYGYVFQSASI